MEQKFINKKIEGIKESNIEKLKRLFPSVFKDGQVDFDELRNQLGDFEEVGQEKYEFNWVGKQEAKQNAISEISGVTLKYYPEESKDAETTENLYIEGDNLKVLKLLRNNYANKIKMIYIDPPYNTGNDTFVYPDTFKKSDKESKEELGITQNGETVVNILKDNLYKNTKDSNKYHSTWLSMIYPRLKVARELLDENGAIFISIDDTEHCNLLKICNEIFGQEHYVTSIPRITKKQRSAQEHYMDISHDYIVCYAYGENFNKIIERNIEDEKIEEDAIGKYIVGDTKALVAPLSQGYSKGGDYDFEYNGVVYKPVNKDNVRNRWLWTEERMKAAAKLGILRANGKTIREQLYIDKKFDEATNEMVDKDQRLIFHTSDFMENSKYSNANGSIDLEKLELKGVFNNPKPVELVKKLIEMILKDDEVIVLDFFAGSSTTAQACIELNAEMNNSKIKYIMVQLQEDLQERIKNASSSEKKTIEVAINLLSNMNKPLYITEIGKERIRRAATKIKEETNANIDYGFKVFKLGETNINWEKEEYKKNVDDYILRNGFIDEIQREELMKDFVDDAKDIDIVYEILLRYYGMPLSAKIEKIDNIGKRTYSIGGTVIICLEDTITNEIIDKLSNTDFAKLYLRDSSFKGEKSLELKQNLMTRLNLQKEYKDEKTYKVEFI